MTPRKSASKSTAAQGDSSVSDATKAVAAQSKSTGRRKSAGQRLVAELSKSDDTYSVKVLIERAGQTADWLERLDAVINGERREWLRLKDGNGATEVMVDSPIREARQLQTELRHLLAEIFRQRVKLPGDGDDDDDVLDGI